MLTGVIPLESYNPCYGRYIQASLWLVKKSTLEELGGWFFRAIDKDTTL